MSIPIGLKDVDVRYDFLDGAFAPQEILGSNGVGNAEFHQALAIAGMNNKFGFSPNEMPQRRTDLTDSGIIVYQVTSLNALTGFSAAGDPLVQVRPVIGASPNTGEYAVDFNNTTDFLNTGRFVFNQSDVNKYYRIHRYYGLGSLNSVKNTFFIELSALATKLSLNGSLAMTGSLNFGSQKGVNLANGTAAGDAVNLSQTVQKTGDTMSGNLTIPNGTTSGHAVNLGQTVQKTGDTMSGNLTIPNGTTSGHAVNLGQTVQKTGDTMSGNLTIPNGTAAGHAVNLGQIPLGNSATSGINAGTHSLSGGTHYLVLVGAGSPSGVFTISINGNVVMRGAAGFNGTGFLVATGASFTLASTGAPGTLSWSWIVIK